MLRSLDIRDMLIIDRLDLGFEPGLNVLTGETGAGKSILLDALGFVLGWRGRAELVRAGAEQGEVTAIFELAADHPAHAVLEEAGLPVGEELILRRVNTREGRKSAWINDRRASGEVLRRLSDTLVELHGQHDDKGLLNPRSHLDLLDAYAGVEAELAETAAAWKAMSAARKALASVETRIAEAQAEEEFLRHAAGELERLSPEPGEEEALDARRRLMQAAEKIGTDIARAAEALGPSGAEGMLGDATRWLSAVADRAEGGLDATLEALERAMLALDEAQRGVQDTQEALQFNPLELEETEERLFAIRGLARKHAVGPEDLPALAEDFRARLAVLDDSEGERMAAAKALAAAEAAYGRAADALRSRRQAAATALDAAMAGELAPLKMERAVFVTRLSEAEAGPSGRDMAVFEVATNPGAPAGPLNRIASGGELSRFLLALKVCLMRAGGGQTVIFDEIDRGVGGATAAAVGRRLAQLARGGQVLVVTHSPQVAALGQHHWQVAKEQRETETISRVTRLDASARVDEIARMLSGDQITDAARAAAGDLLAGK